MRHVVDSPCVAFGPAVPALLPAASAARRKGQRGVTLVELLVAITLVSFLSVGILWALRIAIDTQEKTNQKFLFHRRVLGSEKALRQQLSNLVPVPADCLGPTGQPNGRIMFFEGAPQSMRLVTTFSLEEAFRGHPQIAEFTVIPGKDGQGVRLIVNESPYTGPFSVNGHCTGATLDPVIGRPVPIFRPVEPRASSFILADGLREVRFRYLEVLPPPIGPRWVSRWAELKLPAAIGIELVPLDQSPAAFSVTSVTVPIRTTREPFKAYAD